MKRRKGVHFLLTISLIIVLINFSYLSAFGGNGSLFATANAVPDRIKPGEATTIHVTVLDEYSRMVPGVAVKIISHSGYFVSNQNTTVAGSTDNFGRFSDIWMGCQKWGARGVLKLSILVYKEGYTSMSGVEANVICEN